MAISLNETRAINQIAILLYHFLPGKPHPYADGRISFLGVAHDLGLASFWQGGSKQPAIVRLLERTLDTRRNLFCKLLLEIVRRGLTYREQKGSPITREEIEQLNHLVEQVHFKIPELWDAQFLDSLPSEQPEVQTEIVAQTTANRFEAIKQDFSALMHMPAQARGFAFEKFLKNLFELAGFAPRAAFRLIGEQIDGSLQLDGSTYLLEAKWHDAPLGNADLLVFREKVEAKSVWTRGIIISYSGFTEDGLTAFARGRSTNIIAMTGQDLHFILEDHMPLDEAIRRKTRRAAETGHVLTSVHELMFDV